MKKILLTAVAILNFALFGLAQIPNNIPSNGLISYWPFSGNANDISGNNLHGIVYGATLTTNRNNVSNNSYDFDFTSASFGQRNDEIYIPFSSLLNVNNISVSVWVYPRAYFWSGDANNPNSTIINRYQYTLSTPGGGAWGITFNQTSVTGFLDAPNGAGTSISKAISNTPLTLNQWHNIVMTYDGSQIKLYVNGVLSASQNYSGLMNTSGNSGISIGESNQANGYWTHTNGKIDDIGIWNRALTNQEINSLFTGNPLSISPSFEKLKSLSIYPNPTSGSFYIEQGDFNFPINSLITITDYLGNEVFKSKFIDKKTLITLPTNKGIYFIQIINDNNKLCEKRKLILQ